MTESKNRTSVITLDANLAERDFSFFPLLLINVFIRILNTEGSFSIHNTVIECLEGHRNQMYYVDGRNIESLWFLWFKIVHKVDEES